MTGPPPQPPRVPFPPLESLIAARGGLSAVLHAGGIHRDAPDWERFEKAIAKATDSGRMTVYAADRFAVEVLGCHPSSVWGDAWWHITDPSVELVTSPTGLATWPAA